MNLVMWLATIGLPMTPLILSGDTTMPGLWALDWTLDSIMDSISGLEF